MLSRHARRPRIGLARGFSPVKSLAAQHWLAYATTVGPHSAVFVARADGADTRELFRGTHSTNCPLAWSPDAKTLYHSHDQILALDVSGGGMRAVTDFPAEERSRACWLLECSPNGNTLLFLLLTPVDAGPTGPASLRLCRIGTDGRGFRVLLEDTPDRRLWKADVHWQRNLLVAQLISADQHSELWSMDLDGEHHRRVGSLPRWAYTLALSPEGEHLACAGHDGVHVIALAFGEQRRITTFGGHAAWSPDGAQIAFMGEDYGLWTTRPDGGRPRALVRCTGRNYTMWVRKSSWAVTPAWSPDGRLLWFSLTKTRRLRRPDPGMLRFLQEDGFSEVPEEEREAARSASIEDLRWESTHMVGVVDFADQAVWVSDGHWQNMAWSPLGDKAIGMA